MKDRLIHFYFGLDYKLVWQTIEERMPEVKPLLRRVSDPPPLLAPLVRVNGTMVSEKGVCSFKALGCDRGIIKIEVPWFNWAKRCR